MSKPKPTVLLQSFKPTEIDELLQNTKKHFRQRPLSAATVNRYKHDMQSGHWFVETGDTVKLARVNGKEIVVDGQHRLNAAMHSKDPIFFWVFRYVPLEAFAFLDQGNPRTLKDVFEIHNKGWDHAATVFASTATMLWKHEKTGSPALRPSSDKFEAAGNIAHWAFDTFPDLPDYYKSIEDELSSIQAGGLGGKAWMLYLAYGWSAIDGDLCESIIEHFAVRGKYAKAVSNLHRATEAGKDSPKSTSIMADMTKHPAFKPRNSVLDECRTQVAAFREGAKDPETGKIFKTRNKDLSDFTMFAYQTAWNCLREDRSLRHYKALLKQAINESSYSSIPDAI